MPDTSLHLPNAAATHFSLCMHAAIVAVIRRVVREHDNAEAAFGKFPFLEGYVNQLARNGLEGVSLEQSPDAWRDVLTRWERGVEAHLPLRALGRSCALGHEALEMLMAIGLVEEDARFADVFASLGSVSPEGNPSAGVLAELHDGAPGQGRALLRRLGELGLVEHRNAETSHSGRVPFVPEPLWTAFSGEAREVPAPWARYSPPAAQRPLASLVLSPEAGRFAARLPALLREGGHALIVRGPRHNGRGTIVGAIAKAMGRGTLRVDLPWTAEDPRWKLVGPLAIALDALPLICAEPAPGETWTLPAMGASPGPLAVVLGAQGGVAGSAVERALVLRLDLPDEPARAALWRTAGGVREAAVGALANRYRLASGNIHRMGAIAKSHARLQGRSDLEAADVEAVSSNLNREGLDTLATAIPVRGSWKDLVTDARTARELATLEARCRHRERLRGEVGESLAAQMNAGVRALFRGASGTGKTLSARLLAAALGKELYRIDLSAVVDKYIGETQKRLNRVLDCGEELDVILLLDEGDALLGKRTGVHNANDRHANLETNFLLQRLETFSGILVVTTNAPDLVDTAFRRRMDVVIDFPAPQAEERRAILSLHLPRNEAVDASFLDEVAYRCALTGGQIRNAVLHASLVALDAGRPIATADLEAAVQREYRKAGAVCPLRGRKPATVSID